MLCVFFAIPAYSQIVIQPYDPYDSGSFLDYRRGGIYNGYRRLHTDDVIEYLGYTTYGSEYMRAKSNVTWGFSLTAGGAVASIFGASLLAAVQDSNRFTEEHGMSMRLSPAQGIVPMVIGAACLGVGIPLWVRGSRQMRSMVDDYNQNHRDAYGSNTSITVGPAPGGIGLALNF